MTTAVASFDFWAEAEAARHFDDEICKVSSARDIESDEEDEFGNNILEQRANTALASMVRLPDGDIHLCEPGCTLAVAQPDGDLVCPLSGLVCGHVCNERTDYSTGRSTWSSDPDMAGGAPASGAWRKKIDRVAASKQAHCLANQFDDSVMPTARESQLPAKVPIKRGALCVDEVAEPENGPKRARNSKKEVENSEQIHNLVTEAAAIYSKLMNVKTRHSSGVAVPKKQIDTRLLNTELLFNAALRKYLKEVIARGARPSMDDVHNISLAVAAVVSEEKRKLEDSTTSRAGKFGSIRFRELVSRLAVALWLGACKAPYMDQARRGGDSFRPFVVGVYYSFKRGLTLGDGTVLVPACQGFADALPTQRDVSDNSAAKSLHASSHRGLCSIHRCIASVKSTEQQHDIFSSALQLSQNLLKSKLCV